MTGRIDIVGAGASIKSLRSLDPESAKAVMKALRKTAEPIKQMAQGLVPEIPLTNWYQYGWQSGRLDWWSAAVRRGIAVQVKSGMPRDGRSTSLVAVINRNAAGAVYELAGKVNAGNRLDKGLRASGRGPASRLIWKAFDDLNIASKAGAEVQAVMRDVERRIQSALSSASGGQ